MKAVEDESLEQVKVSELAAEFHMPDQVVISELKKVGVWVPSADTPVDHDIGDRIRRRLQLLVDLEQQEEEKAKEKKEKKEKKKAASPKAKPRKSIRQLGTPRMKAQAEEKKPAESPWTESLKPRKGKGSYRKIELPEDEIPQKVEVSIDDEPLIDRVEAHVTKDVLERVMHKPTPSELAEMVKAKETAEKKKEKAPPPAAPPEAPAPVAEEPVKKPATPPVAEQTPPKEAQAEEAAPEPAAEPAQEAQPAEAAALEVPEKAEPEPEPKTEEEDELREVTFSERITVKVLAEKLKIKSNEVIKELFGRGIMATINQTLDQDLVTEICESRNVIPNFVTFEQAAVVAEKIEEQPEDLVERSPVVTIMGHVDHGKTSLLDSIRKTQVAEGEAGGITQHIGAYHVDVKDKRIVFIDTPGHEAFTRMRSRGAQVTDLVVLVVAADDGVMPQTREAIDHARAAGVPIIVAINKIDKPEAQPQRVRQALSEVNLIPEDWGGDTVVVEVSAKDGTNLNLLLEMILLSADLLELRGNPKRGGAGVVLEAKLDKGRGVVASVLVQNGTLRVGDSFIAGATYGKVRAMFNDRGEAITDAGPSSAVEVLGLQGPPQAGDPFQVVEDTGRAREIGEYRKQQLREQELATSGKIHLDDLYARMKTDALKELKIVLKADAQGSLEVLADTLEKLSTEAVQVKIIHSAVGAITESDVLLASASDAVVVGFNVRPDRTAQDAAEHEKVDMRLHTVIYEVSDEIRQAMEGLLDPTIQETELGQAEVRDTFKVPRFGTIAGCYVTQGVIRKKASARLVRDGVIIYTGEIDSLRRFKDDVSEVKEGYECGISISNFNDVKVGDVIEAFAEEEVAGKL